MGNKNSSSSSIPSSQDHRHPSPSLPNQDPPADPKVVLQKLTVNYQDDEPISNIDPQSESKKLTSKDLEDATKLSLKLKRKIIQSSSFAEQTLPMLVSLITDNVESIDKAPLDLVCVIDNSGSMSGEKMKLVKESFDYLFTFLGDFDRLSIVIFDHLASRIIPLMRMTEKNKQVVRSQLKEVEANGGTNINLGMLHAFEILKQRREVNPLSSIFLLSDGLDKNAQNRVKDSLEKYNISEDVTIHTFGFGSDHDPQLMNDIAALRDGNFYFIQKLDTVDEAFVDCLGALLSSIGKNATIRISPEKSNAFEEGIEITKAYGEASMWAKEGNSYITKMSNVIFGRQKDFVLELKVPKNPKELQDHEKSVKVASAQITMTAFDGEIVTKTADLIITLLNETEEIPEDEEDDDIDVMINFYRLKGASILGEAKKLADENKNEEAKKLLQSLKEELGNSFLKEEEFIINLIRDITKALEYVNPAVYEQYGKHNMLENYRAQMHQKGNLKSANGYQNALQMDMLREVRSMKDMKGKR